MADSNTNYLSLAEASNVFPNRPHPAAVWRWVTRGQRGIQLRAVRFGRKYFTTREWIEDFGTEVARVSIEATTPPKPRNAPKPDKHADHAIAQAQREAEARGL